MGRGGVLITSSRMFPFITVTWNPLGGKCRHSCDYCYAQGPKGIVKQYRMSKYEGEPRLFEHELNRQFKDFDVVFVCNMTNLLEASVPASLVTKILENIISRKEAPTYFFLEKNPARYREFLPLLRRINCILGITLETNRSTSFCSHAPSPMERWEAFKDLEFPNKFVSIEPIMAFDTKELLEIIFNISNLDAVAVGFDNHDAHLPEPPLAQVQELIRELEQHYKVYVKSLREAWTAK